MRDQERDREGNGLSIIGGPSLELNRELSIYFFRLWNSISSWGFRFEGYKMWCGFISLDQFRFKGRVIEGTQTLDLFLLYGGRFLSYQECVGEARERRIGSRGDAYSTRYH